MSLFDYNFFSSLRGLTRKDLPAVARYLYANNVSAIDLKSPMPFHVDIPRLRKGRVGGFFWSA